MYIQVATGVSDITSEVLLETMRGEQNQWEFIQGIFNMFNIVSIPDKTTPNNMILETYTVAFGESKLQNTGTVSDLSLSGRGVKHDWTTKIDVQEIKLRPLTE